MLAIRQELREPMTGVGLHPGDGCARASRRVHPHDRARSLRSEEDHSVAFPASTQADPGIAQSLRGTSACGNRLQFPVREKAEEPAVRRPKRIPGAKRAGERLKLR